MPKQTNLQVLKKWSKTKKRENNVKRKGKENKKTEEATQHAATMYQSRNAWKKQTKTSKNRVEQGPLGVKIIQQENCN